MRGDYRAAQTDNSRSMWRLLAAELIVDIA